MTTIRRERNGDVEAIRRMNELAFDTPAEALLVNLLRERGKLLVSLVAEHDGQPVGHIAFSRVIAESHPDLRGVGLGPMAVVPSFRSAALARCSSTPHSPSVRASLPISPWFSAIRTTTLASVSSRPVASAFTATGKSLKTSSWGSSSAQTHLPERLC